VSIRADASRLPLHDATVDLLVSSPPPGDLAALWAVMDEGWRVLKPTGSAWMNVPDTRTGPGLGGTPWRFVLGLILPDRYRNDGADGPRWILRAEVIWALPDAPEHEHWFHLTREPRYFAGVDEVREAQKYPNHSQLGKSNHLARQWSEDGARSETGHGSFAGQVRQLNPLGKLPGSVWSMPPDELPRRIVAGWSPVGICVECGEARRAVVAKGFRLQPDVSPERNGDHGKLDASNRWASAPRGSNAATITGYACACSEPTAATRPAVVLDPFANDTPTIAGTMGRYGVGLEEDT
jgi:hypothetical protein